MNTNKVCSTAAQDERIENGSDNENHINNKPDNGGETLSWWRRTTSLPSSLNRRKNIWFQKMFKSTTDLKKKRTPTHHQKSSTEKQAELILPKNSVDLTEENLIVTNSIATQTISKENSQNAKGYSVYAMKILELQDKISQQETLISTLKQKHDLNLGFISNQLFELQRNLMKKEKLLSGLIKEREQTILEQQRVIRRLLRKSVSDNGVVTNHGSGKNSDERDSCFNSDPEQEDESEQDPPMEISISVPNLSELGLLGGYATLSTITKPDIVERSISENESEKQNIKKLNQIKMERRAKNREKLMAMKRFSGFLKRPEILETVYSVEEEEKQKSEEKPDEEMKNNATNEETDTTKTSDEGEDKVKEASGFLKREKADKEEDFEPTDFDCSTDDDSLRMIFSSTDQSNCCSEICSRRSSAGSYPTINRVGARPGPGLAAGQHDGQGEEGVRSRSQEDLRSKMRLIQRRKKFLMNNQSVSLDHGDGVN